jgi:hypothetical protein
MLHEQLNPMGRLGCTLLSLILNKPMTPFQGMHYGNTLGKTPLQGNALWKHLETP